MAHQGQALSQTAQELFFHFELQSITILCSRFHIKRKMQYESMRLQVTLNSYGQQQIQAVDSAPQAKDAQQPVPTS
jgi:hypothetical protein